MTVLYVPCSLDSGVRSRVVRTCLEGWGLWIRFEVYEVCKLSSIFFGLEKDLEDEIIDPMSSRSF